MRRLSVCLVACVLTLPLSPVRAETDPFDRLEPDRMLGRLFSEDNLSLFFSLIRRSVAAAAEGGESPEPSAAERRRLAEEATALRGEVLRAMGSVLGAAEAEVRKSLAEEFSNR
ncbi:MAG TPA: hypothetical protein PK375_11800 [Rhodocyclaceae bacterium]|nr:hypothetical protein [Rhodocyclaceae bacterium]HNH36594.1 hypothetical protein [Rhodocyclaceae bacterium]